MPDRCHTIASVFSRRARAAAFAALTVAALSSHHSGATEPLTILTCTNLVSGASWPIKVSLEQRTVDSNPARISSAEISWHSAADGGNYTLDRKSGRLTVVFPSSTGGYSLRDRCSPRI